MPSGFDYLPYRPAAPEAQPQGGLLQGLEEGLDRLTKENAMKRQLALKAKYDEENDQRSYWRSLALQREHTAGQLHLAEEADRRKQAMRDAVWNAPLDYLKTGTTTMTMPQESPQGMVQPNVWRDNTNGTKKLNNIVDLTKPQPFKFTMPTETGPQYRTLGEALSDPMLTKEEFLGIAGPRGVRAMTLDPDATQAFQAKSSTPKTMDEAEQWVLRARGTPHEKKAIEWRDHIRAAHIAQKVSEEKALVDAGLKPSREVEASRKQANDFLNETESEIVHAESKTPQFDIRQSKLNDEANKADKGRANALDDINSVADEIFKDKNGNLKKQFLGLIQLGANGPELIAGSTLNPFGEGRFEIFGDDPDVKAAQNAIKEWQMKAKPYQDLAEKQATRLRAIPSELQKVKGEQEDHVRRLRLLGARKDALRRALGLSGPVDVTAINKMYDVGTPDPNDETEVKPPPLPEEHISAIDAELARRAGKR